MWIWLVIRRINSANKTGRDERKTKGRHNRFLLNFRFTTSLIITAPKVSKGFGIDLHINTIHGIFLTSIPGNPPILFFKTISQKILTNYKKITMNIIQKYINLDKLHYNIQNNVTVRDIIRLCLRCDISVRQHYKWLSHPLLQAGTILIWTEMCWKGR